MCRECEVTIMYPACVNAHVPARLFTRAVGDSARATQREKRGRRGADEGTPASSAGFVGKGPPQLG
eukprot:scaffold1143_cov107-Isochrysis_galbana.AAC.4